MHCSQILQHTQAVDPGINFDQRDPVVRQVIACHYSRIGAR